MSYSIFEQDFLFSVGLIYYRFQFIFIDSTQLSVFLTVLHLSSWYVYSEHPHFVSKLSMFRDATRIFQKIKH